MGPRLRPRLKGFVMAPKTVLVRHPEFDHVVEEVPTEKVKEWTDAGWTRVTRAEEPEIRAERPGE